MKKSISPNPSPRGTFRSPWHTLNAKKKREKKKKKTTPVQGSSKIPRGGRFAKIMGRKKKRTPWLIKKHFRKKLKEGAVVRKKKPRWRCRGMKLAAKLKIGVDVASDIRK